MMIRTRAQTTSPGIPAESPAESTADSWQTLECIAEYVSRLEPAARTAFMDHLRIDERFRREVEKAVTDMSMLIAAIFVLADEDDYARVAETTLADSASELPAVRTLRQYYVDHIDQIELLHLDGVADATRQARLAQVRQSLSTAAI